MVTGRYVLFILTMSLVSLACTTKYQVRGVEDPFAKPVELSDLQTEDDSTRRDFEARSVENFQVGESHVDADLFKIGILEVTKSGSVSGIQREQVFAMLDDQADLAASTNRKLVILVFVHGWHHGPLVCDNNLACFRDVVANLATRRDGNQYVGLYVGWRGESLPKERVNLITIWSRKRAAEGIGRRGAFNLLSDLNRKYQELNERHKRPVLMVSVGHSLGAGLLFSSLQQKLVGTLDVEGKHRYIRSSESYREPRGIARPKVSGFGDLAILINPAIEASRYQVFHQDASERYYPDSQGPVLTVITSRADRATRFIFPISRGLRAFVEPWNLFSNWRRDWTAMGHYRPHRTHKLVYKGKKETRSERSLKTCECKHPVPEVAEGPQEEALLPDSFSSVLARYLRNSEFELNKQIGLDPNSPFWVIRTDRSVVRSHNDIYNPVFVDFLYRFISAYVDHRT